MFHKVKGFHDIYGLDIEYWQQLENILKKLYKSYGIKEFRLPILEKTTLFKRGIGETTDIVEKEMFTFIDNDNESLSLRPEGTASLIRAYIENGLHNPPGVKKYFYIGNMFRRERPQKGRFRQFTQSGVEILEVDSPLLDAEVITLLYDVARSIGIDDIVKIEINSIGCNDCRPSYLEKLIKYFKEYEEELCEDCKRRLYKNPMRILDCKNEKCKIISDNSPSILKNLCDNCDKHFNSVKKYLEKLSTPYTVNIRMVRGLDYYVKTAFEMITDKLGSATAVGAGGRYDGLVELMGGNSSYGIGFALGMDRLVSLMKEKKRLSEQKADIFIIFFEGKSESIGLNLVKEYRSLGFCVEYDYEVKGMKNQMKKANRSGAKYCVILGEEELFKNMATVKDLESSQQKEIDIRKIIEYIKLNSNKL